MLCFPVFPSASCLLHVRTAYEPRIDVTTLHRALCLPAMPLICQCFPTCVIPLLVHLTPDSEGSSKKGEAAFLSHQAAARCCASQPAIIGPSRHCSLVGSSLQRGIARTGAARSSDKADAIASVVTLPSRSRRAANVLQGDTLCFRAKIAAA